MTKEVEKEIEDFLNDSGRGEIIIKYKGRRLNAACDWASFRSPLPMLFRAFFGEVFKKLPPCSFKNYLYRMIGFKIGKDVVIGPDVLLDPLFPELIVIEDGAILGWGCKIITHEILISKIRLGRVAIGKKSIIGAFSVVRSGVKIGENSIVSLCSLVNKDVKDNEIVGGIPIKKIEAGN